jgi:hypothetical protein
MAVPVHRDPMNSILFPARAVLVLVAPVAAFLDVVNFYAVAAVVVCVLDCAHCYR